ncbi:MAG: biopolymer transporter Tol, partial [Pirellulaceae bacterium]
IIWSGADHSRPGRPNYNLWLMKYEESDKGIKKLKTWQITDSSSADVLPVFSPDGTQLMWTSTRSEDGSSQLFISDFQLPEAEKKDQE